MSRKAFFGGSFDPPHTGHLGIARAVLASGRCDEVVWFPGYMPPHKANSKRAPFADRMAMIELLIASEPGMSVSDFENRLRLSPSYTVDVLRRLREETGETYILLVGADSLHELHTWHEARALVREFEIVAYPRDGWDVSERTLAANWDAPTAKRLADAVIPGKFFKISSSEMRFSMEKSLSRRHIISSDGLTAEVAAYIRTHKLYTGST